MESWILFSAAGVDQSSCNHGIVKYRAAAIMNDLNPLVSIGLPVYNGENYLAEALDSLLAQTYTHFELIISDNASTDRTPEICQVYAARDVRIRYYRNGENLGAAANYNRVFALSSGKYFKWAAHDDVHAPEMLEQCMEVLERDESIVLCHTKTVIIDEHGKPYLNYLAKLDTMSDRPSLRFRETIGEHWCYQVFGVFRSSVLEHTRLIDRYSDSDRVLLAELALRGRVHEVPRILFFRRDHPETSTRRYVSIGDRMAWFDPKARPGVCLAYWLKFKGYLSAISRAPLSRRERFLTYVQLSRLVVLRVVHGLTGHRSHLVVPVVDGDWISRGALKPVYLEINRSMYRPPPSSLSSSSQFSSCEVVRGTFGMR